MPDSPPPDQPGALFRAEVTARRFRAASEASGDVLRLSPRWVDSAYAVVLAIAAASLALALAARVGEYASGPAVVQFEDRRAVTATSAGTVASVAVSPGAAVAAGDPLIVLHDDLEEAELERAEEQFEVALVEFLRDPSALAARTEVARRRSERTAAAARAEARVVRAPLAGIVSDVYALPGLALEPGALIATVRGEKTPPRVLALLPGRVRPLLAEGQVLELDLPGFDRASRQAEVVSIGGEVVGPAQARRILGPEAQDAVTLDEPAVVVRARLLQEALEDDGRSLPYFHGMTGTATVRVRSEPVLVALFPALRRWW